MKLFVENTAAKSIIIGLDTDETPIGYLDKTTIEGLDGEELLINHLEYNNIRKWIEQLMLINDADPITAFNLCTSVEKSIICKYQLMPYSVRLNYFTDEEDLKYWNELVIRTEGNAYVNLIGRSKIYHDLRICVSDFVRREIWFPNDYYSNLNYAQQFLKEVHLLKEYYISANDPELGLFLRSEGVYLNNGFNSKIYWLQELEDNLLNIYNVY